MAKQKAELEFALIDKASAGLKKISGELNEIVVSAGKVTAAAAGIAAGIAAIGAGFQAEKAISGAADLETSLKRVQAVTGATSEEIAGFREQIERTAQTAAVSTEQAAATVEQLARGGLSATEAVAALGPALDLAAASALSTNDAAALLVDTLDQFGLSGDQAAQVADKLASAAKVSGTGVGQMADAFRAVAPFAREAGLSFDQVAAALGSLAQQGLEGGQAGKGLRALLSELADGSSKLAVRLKSAGVNVKDFGAVLKFLGSDTKAAQDAVAALSDQGKAALAALSRDGGANMQALIEVLQRSQGAAAEVADTINSTFNAAFDRFKNTLDELRSKVAEPILEPLTNALNDLAKRLLAFSQGPEFKDLQRQLGELFKDGTAAAIEFVESIDFQALVADIKSFVSESKSSLQGFGETLGSIGSTIESTVDGVRIVFNGFQTGLSALALGTTKLMAELVRPFALFSDTAQEAFDALSENVRTFEDEFGKQLDETKAALADFNEESKRTEESTRKLGEGATEAALGLAQLADKQKEIVETGPGTTAALDAQTAAIKRYNEQAQETARETTALAQASSEAIAQSAKDTAARAAAVIQAQKDAAAANREAIQANKEAGEAAKESSEAQVQGAQEVSGAAGGLIAVINQLHAHYRSISEAAGEYFQEALGKTLETIVSVRGLGQAIERADKATRDAVAAQQTAAAGIGATFDALGAEGEGAFAKIASSANATAEDLERFAAAGRAGALSLDLIGKSDLGQLIAKAEQAADRIRGIKDAAADAVAELASLNRELQDQADREAGNEEAVADREFQDQLRRIAELEEAAGAAGQRQATEARARAEAAHQRRLEQIEEERKARALADREAGGSGGGGSGGTGFAAPGAPAAPAQPAGGAPTTNITVNVTGFVGSEEDLVDIVERGIRRRDFLKPPKKR